jgi:hypothetical protein
MHFLNTSLLWKLLLEGVMTATIDFSLEQENVLAAAQRGNTFLSGKAGTGKTSVALQHIIKLVKNGVSGNQILIIIPQRMLAKPYYDLIQSFDLPSGSIPAIATLGGLAQRMITLFWPLVRAQYGFFQKDSPPIFLTLETAQYYLANIADSIIDTSGYFTSLKIKRNRLYSQILDNLNKAALVGFSLDEIGERLSAAWNGESGHTIIYHQAQEIARQFRSYCFQNNLLDFSLQMEIFHRFLSHQSSVRTYLQDSYSHLVYDNVEEDAPASHDLIEDWMPQFNTALFIKDDNAGYRSFMGADPVSVDRFKHYCPEIFRFTHSFESSEPIQRFSLALSTCIYHDKPEIDKEMLDVFSTVVYRLAPESNQAVVQQIEGLVNSGISPSQIAILTPFLNDTTRFTLSDALEKKGILCRSHRPSRPLNAEPASKCLLALAKLAHPQWHLSVNNFEFRNALMVAIGDLDMVRSAILSDIVLRKKQDMYVLSSFDEIKEPSRIEQITYILGNKYETLRLWLNNYQQDSPVYLDIFLSRLFGEVLSQPGFGFHDHLDNAAICARLIESVQKFRKVVTLAGTLDGKEIGHEYVEMVNRGVLAAQYLEQDDHDAEDAVLISPAYSFLMSNHPVDYQFWLDVGSISWSERLEQPLTHPYVLSRNWKAEDKWTHAHENQLSNETLSQLINGLSARCNQHIFLYASGLSEQGQEQSSPFLKALQRLNRSLFQIEDVENV